MSSEKIKTAFDPNVPISFKKDVIFELQYKVNLRTILNATTNIGLFVLLG
jgi:hypothetical protein